MIQDVELRRFSPRTQRSSPRAVAEFAKHYHKVPDISPRPGGYHWPEGMSTKMWRPGLGRGHDMDQREAMRRRVFAMIGGVEGVSGERGVGSTLVTALFRSG
jgi:hypothetical protein